MKKSTKYILIGVVGFLTGLLLVSVLKGYLTTPPEEELPEPTPPSFTHPNERDEVGWSEINSESLQLLNMGTVEGLHENFKERYTKPDYYGKEYKVGEVTTSGTTHSFLLGETMEVVLTTTPDGHISEVTLTQEIGEEDDIEDASLELVRYNVIYASMGDMSSDAKGYIGDYARSYPFYEEEHSRVTAFPPLELEQSSKGGTHYTTTLRFKKDEE